MAEITQVGKYVIEKTNEKRVAAKTSQAALSQLLDVSQGFIGNIENPTYRIIVTSDIRMNWLEFTRGL